MWPAETKTPDFFLIELPSVPDYLSEQIIRVNDFEDSLPVK